MGGCRSAPRCDGRRSGETGGGERSSKLLKPLVSNQGVVPCPWAATNVRGAMPIPPYEGLRTYFFFADVEPKELMTFGVEAGI